MRTTSILLFALLVCGAVKVHAQAKNAIGLGLALNTSRENSNGFGALLQGEVKVANAVSITPYIGGEVTYSILAGLSGRYYFSKEIYTSAGAFGHLDPDYSGFGATAGVGFMLVSDHHQSLDLNLHGDYMKKGNQPTPVAGVRLIYSFSFTRLE
ncbi:hypothetical protein SAMN05192574_11512 [Mucilaginibacter gossypiicola]|uniref:Outer membrane protein beta-barrel domain-containing protein n=1 Tax=Mucilaginibacter gossypiicola TaxID=551995 RepID=A0A1H8TA11_9SPHI|nr:hypothetical protein [Mucilaginibacter gossypiicola]SEO87757.1 hypothetical protein SAMN05192574_11512 [Mucilaginibacter gossypiicola]